MDATHEPAGGRDAPRLSTIRTLFDRRNPANANGTIWRRRVSGAKAAAIIIASLGTASAGVIAAVRHEPVARTVPSSIDSTLGAQDRRIASLERYRDTINAFMFATQRQQDSARSDQRMNKYMLCIITRQLVPVAAPLDCPLIPPASSRRR
jgi:hypothetical protein